MNYPVSDWKSCALDIKCAAKTLRSYYNAFAQVSIISQEDQESQKNSYQHLNVK